MRNNPARVFFAESCNRSDPTPQHRCNVPAGGLHVRTGRGYGPTISTSLLTSLRRRVALGLGLTALALATAASPALADTAVADPATGTSTPPAQSTPVPAEPTVPVVTPTDPVVVPPTTSVPTEPVTPPETAPPPAADEAYAPPPETPAPVETPTPSPAPAPAPAPIGTVGPGGGANAVPLQPLASGPDTRAPVLAIVTDKPDVAPVAAVTVASSADAPPVAATTTRVNTGALSGPDVVVQADVADHVTTLTEGTRRALAPAAASASPTAAPSQATFQSLDLRGHAATSAAGADRRAVSPAKKPVTASDLLAPPAPAATYTTQIVPPSFGVGSSHGSSGILEMLAGYVFPGAANNSGGALLLLFPLALLMAALTPRIPRLHLHTVIAQSGAGCPGFDPVLQRPG